jgi:hypothetical protein
LYKRQINIIGESSNPLAEEGSNNSLGESSSLRSGTSIDNSSSMSSDSSLYSSLEDLEEEKE